MNAICKRFAVATLAALLCACAGQNVRHPSEAANAEPLDAEDAPLSASAEKDPWEGLNRKIFAFNSTLDRFILKPAAKTYATLAPKPVKTGVSNFFKNLQQPVSAVNLLLQGHPVQAATATGRFAFNVVFGLGGLFDPATPAEIPYRDRDFGQTFAQWGWQDSRYFVMPVFGPTTLRDGIGSLTSSNVSPMRWLDARERAYLGVLYGLNARASVLSMDPMIREAADPYLLVRDAFLQRRHCQIVDCSEEVPDYLLPDYDYEIPDFDSLRRP